MKSLCAQTDDNLANASRNLRHFDIIGAQVLLHGQIHCRRFGHCSIKLMDFGLLQELNAYEVLKRRKLVLTEAAVDILHTRLANSLKYKSIKSY